MARIICVYRPDLRPADRPRGRPAAVNMGYGRWLSIAGGLRAIGHEVDLAVAPGTEQMPIEGAPLDMPRVALPQVRWDRYDVVKTSFHRGYETLEAFGGAGHPCVISHLSSVVAAENRPGIYFYDSVREALFATQERVVRRCHAVSVLNEQARTLLAECHGARGKVLCVAGAADRVIPARGADPYPARERGEIRVLFAGNIYNDSQQPEANRTLGSKLNELGAHLARRGASLYMIGSGDVRRLDSGLVRYLGEIPYDRSWQHLYHADVGVVVAAGPFHHNNESTKIYCYLRAGLPFVTESGFPNEFLIAESGLGMVVRAGDPEQLAERAVEASHTAWDREQAVRYILDNHTWERRAAVYEGVIQQALCTGRLPVSIDGRGAA